MRSALLCTIPMLVLAAACADTDPLAPRHDARGVAASLGHAMAPGAVAAMSTCEANATSASLDVGALGAMSTSMSGTPHTLATVRVWASAPFSIPALLFLPVNGWRVPRYHCPVPGHIPGVGDISVTYEPDTTTVVDPPRPPGVDDAFWGQLSVRFRAWIWEKAVEYADRCGCGETRENVFSAMVSTLEHKRADVLARPPLTVTGVTFTDDVPTLLLGHAVACELTKVFRRYWALDDDRDRAWLLRGVTADVADRSIPYGVAIPYGINWQSGVTAGFRVGANGSCTQELATQYYHRTLALETYKELRSPAPAPPYFPPRLPEQSPPWNDQ